MSAPNPINFSILPEKYCVAKLPPQADCPEPPTKGVFFSLTRTDDELSIVCEETQAPLDAEIERNWTCFKVQGPLEFSLKGVLLSLLAPLEQAGAGVFVISTYNTDYVFIKTYHLEVALAALQSAGHVNVS